MVALNPHLHEVHHVWDALLLARADGARQHGAQRRQVVEPHLPSAHTCTREHPHALSHLHPPPPHSPGTLGRAALRQVRPFAVVARRLRTPPQRAHLWRGTCPEAAMVVVSSPSRRRCLLLVLKLPSHAVNLRRRTPTTAAHRRASTTTASAPPSGKRAGTTLPRHASERGQRGALASCTTATGRARTVPNQLRLTWAWASRPGAAPASRAGPPCRPPASACPRRLRPAGATARVRTRHTVSWRTAAGGQAEALVRRRVFTRKGGTGK